MAGRLVELSHTIRDGLVTFPGAPAPSLRAHVSRADSARGTRGGHTFEIMAIDMIATTGTHVDAPSYYLSDGADLSALDLEHLVDLPGLLINAAGHRAIERFHLIGDPLKGRAVLFRTDWSQRFGTPAYGAPDAPFLSEATAHALIDGGAALVGIDTASVDDRDNPAQPVHVALLSAGIPIVENLANLTALPAGAFRFTAAPPMIERMSSFPVRAFAVLEHA